MTITSTPRRASSSIVDLPARIFGSSSSRRSYRRPSSNRQSSSRTTILFSLVLIFLVHVIHPVQAQFGNFFDHIFQQQQHHDSPEQHDDHDDGHHHGSSSSSRSGGGGSFNKFSQLMEMTKCSGYLCPSSLDCVTSPSDCPCPFVEDIKCPIVATPSSSSSNKNFEDSFICTRAPGCSQVQKALKFGSSSSST